MGALTEVEIFDRMATSLREAAECCDILAKSSRKGPTYNRLREHLALIEGCCRQASTWREDTRWLGIGLIMAECHKKAGGWLRGYKDPLTKVRQRTPVGEMNMLFVMLAVNLRGLYGQVEKLKTAKTGVMGMILPETPAAARQSGAPVGWRASKGGVLLPN